MKKSKKKKLKLSSLEEMVYDAVGEALTDYKSNYIPEKYDNCTFCGSPPFSLIQEKNSEQQYIWWSICKWCVQIMYAFYSGPEKFNENFWVKNTIPHTSFNTENALSEIERILNGKN